MGAAASAVPDVGATAAEVKAAVGCLFDDEAFKSCVNPGRDEVVRAGSAMGVSEPSEVVVRNLCNFVECRKSLDSLWEGYVSDNGGSDDGLADFVSFDDRVWKDWGSRICDPAFVQHRLGGSGRAAENLGELLEAAKAALVQYEKVTLPMAISKSAVSCEPKNLLVAPLKGADRIQVKVGDLFARTTPASPFSVVHDVVRASYIADSVADAAALVRWLLESGSNEGSEIEVIRLENRFARPTVTGYRDANLSLRIVLSDGTQHVCELQIHLRQIKARSVELRSHETYELFRRIFHGDRRALQENLKVMLTMPRCDYKSCDEVVSDAVKHHDELGNEVLRGLAVLMEKLSQFGASEVVRRSLIEQTRPAQGECASKEYGAALYNLARLLYLQGPSKDDETVAFTKQSLAAWTEAGGGSREVVQALQLFGEIQLRQRKLDKAETLFKQAVTAAAAWKDDYEGQARSLNSLALVKKEQGQRAEAKELLSQCVELSKKLPERLRTEHAVWLNNLGRVLLEMGSFDEAEEPLRDAREIFERAYGDDHENMAGVLNNLASLAQRQRRLDEAEQFYRRALRVRTTIYGEVHPVVAESLNNLALLLAQTRRYAEAKTLFERTLVVLEKVYGEEHLHFVSTLLNYGKMLRAQGNLSLAIPIYERFLALFAKTHGDGHQQYDTALNELADTHRALGEFETAENHYRRALANRTKIFGEEHWRVGEAHNNIAAVLWKKGDYDAAMLPFERSVAICTKALGDEHQTTRNYKMGLSMLQQRRPCPV